VIRWIVGSSARFPLVVIAVAAAVLTAGVHQAATAPVDALPEFAPPTIEVQTEALGLSAPEVEDLVTLNLEELLNGTPWLVSIHSTSVPGLSSILLTFEPGTDILRARQLVQERLTLSFAIPNVAKPPIIIQPLSTTNRVMMVGLSSSTVSPIEMGVIARWDIRPTLLAVPGVANVAIWGQRERQLQVQVHPDRLLANDVTLDQVIRSTGNAMWVSPLTFLQASTPGAGGWIDTPQQRLEVRHVFPISTAEDLAKVSVDGAAPLRLGDVADVVLDHQPLIGDAALTGQESSLLVIEKFPNANTLDVTRGVEDALNRLRPGLVGINVDTSVARPATYIDRSIDNLTISVLLGAVLLVVCLAILLRNWRVALIAAISVAVALAAAVLVFSLRGETVNMMVFAGLAIALGIVVDDAVAGTDAILARVRGDRDGGSRVPAATAVLEATGEARRGLLYGVLIAAIPLLPVVFAEGVPRAVAEPLAISYVLAVLASALVAVTVTPALAVMLRPTRSEDRDPQAIVRWARTRYVAALAWVLARPVAVLATACAVTLLALATAPFIEQSMFPSFRDSAIVVRWEGPPGTSEPEMARLTDRVGNELKRIPGVAHVGANLGRAVLGDRVVDVNSAELWVSADDSADHGATLAAVRRTVDGYPGVRHEVSTYLDDRVRQFGNGSGRDILVRVFGPAFGTLEGAAEQVRSMLSHVDGVAGISMERPPRQPQIEVEVDLARAKRYGLKPGDVRRAAATMLAGLEVGSLFEQQKVFQVVVWSVPDSRSSLTGIRNLLIDTPNGGHVRLDDVADVRIASTPTVIERDAVSRRIDIGVDVGDRSPGDVAADISHRLADMPLPLEYHAEVVGEYQTSRDLHRRMLGAGLAAAVAIFLLLQAAFQSWRLATMFFLTLPVALSGGVLAAFVTSGRMTLGSLAALMAVLAVAAKGGITLIRRFQALERSGYERGQALVVEGALAGFRPLLVGALATTVALLPLVATGTVAGQEIANPVAVVVIGGLVTSTLVTAFLIPTLYLALTSLQPGRPGRLRGRRRTIRSEEGRVAP